MATPSYPTVQRKVRAINLELGTKYSAKEVWQREKNANEKGYTTHDWSIISQFKGVRADVKAPKSQATGTTAFFSEFYELSNQSPYVAAIMTADTNTYVSGTSIYKVSSDTITEIKPSGAPVIVDKLPDGAQQLDNRTGYKLIKAYTKAIHDRQRHAPGSGYNAEEIESYYT